MEFQFEHRNGLLSLSGDMTIYHATSMKNALLGEGLGSGSDVSLDLANVTELDTCGLQMLLMVRQRAVAEGRRLACVASSPAVREVLDLCGLRALYFTEQQVA